MKSAKDPRHVARIISVMDLYKFFFPDTQIINDFDIADLEIGNFSKKIYESLTTGVKEHAPEIDVIIDKHSVPLKTTDLDTLLLQIIRVAVFEGFIAKSVPPKVAVDEAIELTRDFGIEIATRKVSGILGKIFDSELKPEQTPME